MRPQSATASQQPGASNSGSASPAAGSLQRSLELQRSGWLEKFSVGRGIFGVKNWQKRYFTVSHNGLNYSKGKDITPESRTFIPFVQNEGFFEVRMNPVFLLPNVTPAIHSSANEPNYYYFGIRFEEKGKGHVLLLRTSDMQERDNWVRFLARFIHVGSLQLGGVPPSHPLDPSSPRAFDPEELDVNEKKVLRRVVMEWDEGIDLRVANGVIPADNTSDLDEEDFDGGASPSYAAEGATPPKGATPSASAVQTPRAPPLAVELEDVDEGRSGAQASNRSHAVKSSAAPAPPASAPRGEYDVL